MRKGMVFLKNYFENYSSSVLDFRIKVFFKPVSCWSFLEQRHFYCRIEFLFKFSSATSGTYLPAEVLNQSWRFFFKIQDIQLPKTKASHFGEFSPLILFGLSYSMFIARATKCFSQKVDSHSKSEFCGYAVFAF